MRSKKTALGRRRFLLVVATVAAASVGMVASPAAAVSSYGFNKPTAIAVNGGNLWIANYAGNSVTETNSAGAWLRIVHGPTFGFNGPDAIASYLGDVFVVNHAGSVTELNASTGALVRVVKGVGYDFVSPTAVIAHGGDVWVVDSGSNAVTEFSATTGALVRTLTNVSNPHFGFTTPDAIALAGTNLWVTSKTGGSTTNVNEGAVTEFSVATGAFVRRVIATADGLQKPSGVAFDGVRLWISDAVTNSVTELNAAGVLIRIISNTSLDQNYGFDAPTVVVASSPNVYVVSPPGASPMVTQITTATAEGNWYECNTNTPDPDFANPTALVVSAGHVWVVSPADNTLTELSLALGGNRVNVFT
jgi:hypothetical protein